MAYGGRITLNVRIALVGEELEIRENVNIEIEEGIITHIGNGFSSEGITFKNGILIPGIVNAHVHSADFICQEMGYNMPISKVVGDPHSVKYECFAKNTKESIMNSIERFVLRARELGSNVMIDFREQGLEGSLISSTIKKKMATNGVKYYFLGRLEEDEFKDIRNLNSLYKIADGYGLSSAFSTSEIELIKHVFNNKIRSVHVSETIKHWLRDDLEYVMKRYEPNLIIHGTYLSEEEIDIMRYRKASIVYCPRSNLWFSVGIPKVINGLKSGVNLLIGTDNGGVLDPDMWKEMETLLLISRVQDPLSDHSLQILKASTINAYKFLGIRGWIEEGNPIEAGLLVLEGDSTGILNSNNKYIGIIKRGNKIIYNLGAIQKII
ncbi:N-ethylammeline chlorohydrolase [Saccharolobus solfataricus]|uniref:N-ethylammeline chlorohydrolase related protein (TrzA-like) n=3 Tax=Saccharolobus solfataricus TaxID=2287 RepID=Q980B7_SACS2|nr:amidohydrolase family protein [Saccharolobus solfataricus]AAK40727.1 N-ethylammeline chlorohydrolase related protein (trzA-like) [Saccharolobus solfataricus P2]AKA73704.1 N-ethylammeline chlorohydrolase [Saccharolobus solfataricus]AKA76401.1 N-ethylammeline chlorohydrolase [Saccharolobus solfataricus]AKA79094.1 N-ethylammeline chlorohydrolase [Saccharolobus solfataricus]AZF68175.1 N-ethylammeline chlorohydrolase [Saccharolobus solfataricus]